MIQLSPEECSEPMVLALVEAYRNSKHGRSGKGRREFNVRYDKLVHKLAHASVVEEKRGRAIFERLRIAGIMRWDHIPLQRNQIKTLYIPLTSERSFFLAVGEIPPSHKRTTASNRLISHLDALKNHPNELEWKAAILQAADDINNGRSPEGLPNDPNLHEEILSATAAVLNNRQRILIRRLSAEKLRNSKLLQRRRETVERFMAQFLPPDLAKLDAWKVADTPPSVLLRGPLGIELDDGTRIGQLKPGSPYTIREELLVRARNVVTSSQRCLSVENETTFREVAAVNVNDLIIHTSYPSGSVIKLLQLLPPTMRLQHWGDTDPWGYDILRVLRERTGRLIQPWRMNYRPMAGVPLSKRESAILGRLIVDPNLDDIRRDLTAMQSAGSKGDFEQESLPFVNF